MRALQIAATTIGGGSPCYIIGEIGINHNGDLDTAKQLIDAAARAGCDAVKFQKRTPKICVPEAQREVLRETPWGLISYMEYREKIEFGREEFEEIDRHCQQAGIAWFASAWDLPSLEFLEEFDCPCYKVPSALITDLELLRACNRTGKPIMISTGMSTMEEIRKAVSLLDGERLLIAHCTSTYPCPLTELNLNMIPALKRDFDAIIGYSGHEVGLATTYAAVTLGADFVERHITLDRAMWGSDQAASIEPDGLKKLVSNIRNIEIALGDGVKKVYFSEMSAKSKLRVVRTEQEY